MAAMEGMTLVKPPLAAILVPEILAETQLAIRAAMTRRGHAILGSRVAALKAAVIRRTSLAGRLQSKIFSKIAGQKVRAVVAVLAGARISACPSAPVVEAGSRLG